MRQLHYNGRKIKRHCLKLRFSQKMSRNLRRIEYFVQRVVVLEFFPRIFPIYLSIYLYTYLSISLQVRGRKGGPELQGYMSVQCPHYILLRFSAQEGSMNHKDHIYKVKFPMLNDESFHRSISGSGAEW